MPQLKLVLAALPCVLALGLVGSPSQVAGLASALAAKPVPTAKLVHARLLYMPGVTLPPESGWEYVNGVVDSNSPVIWLNGKLHMYNSCCAVVFHSSGPGLSALGGSGPVEFNNEHGPRWIESVVKADDGTLYGFYHHEDYSTCEGYEVKPGAPILTAPDIGVAKSTDGMHWQDLGIVLTAPPNSLVCNTKSYWYAGGVGDLSAIRARDGYVYVFFGAFTGDVTEQGIAVARLRHEDLDSPVGKAMKWRAGRWDEPGLGGHVTPVVQNSVSVHELNANGWWGAVVSWNTYLKRYVMTINRIKDYIWTAEGAYVAFTPTLGNPYRWSAPQRLIKLKGTTQQDGFAEAIGTDTARQETDTLMGRTARFFLGGRSMWKIVFRKGRK